MKKSMTQVSTLFFLAVFSCLAITVSAEEAVSSENSLAEFKRSGDFAAARDVVVEKQEFFGLASYYNAVAFYTLGADGPSHIAPQTQVELVAGERFVAVGRFNVLVLQAPAPVELEVLEETFSLAPQQSTSLALQLLRKDQLWVAGEELDALRYQHLWAPLAWLSKLVESSVSVIKSSSALSWGWSIVLFSLLLKMFMLPLSICAGRLQTEVASIQSELAPKLAQIKLSYDGEEAHKRIMAAHKDLGVSTFFSLKPLFALFLQVPVWIAVFNALGEMPQLDGQGFLWIENLAYPDSVAALPVMVPLLGGQISLLPMLMALVMVASSLLLRDMTAPAEQVKRQTRNAVLTALAFLVLFYPFPAAMVLYWTLSNTLQIVQQQVLKR